MEKLQVISAEDGEAVEAPRCVIVHNWIEGTGLFNRPDFPLLEFQGAIRHEMEYVHQRPDGKTGGVETTPEALAANTNRTFFLSTNLLPLLMLSPFDGDPQKAMDFAYPEVAAQRLQEQRFAVFETTPPGEKVIRIVPPSESLPTVEVVIFEDPALREPLVASDFTKAFDQVYELNYQRIYRTILSRVNSPEDAEDIAQTVFLNAFRSISRYEERGRPIITWLQSIAHNEVINYYRKARYNQPLDVVDFRLGHVEESQIVERLDKDMGIDEKSKRLRVAREQLNPDQQIILRMLFDEGLTYRQVAEKTGKQEGTIRVIVFRAKKILQKLLHKEVFFEPDE